MMLLRCVPCMGAGLVSMLLLGMVFGPEVVEAMESGAWDRVLVAAATTLAPVIFIWALRAPRNPLRLGLSITVALAAVPAGLAMAILCAVGLALVFGLAFAQTLALQP